MFTEIVTENTCYFVYTIFSHFAWFISLNSISMWSIYLHAFSTISV